MRGGTTMPVGSAKESEGSEGGWGICRPTGVYSFICGWSCKRAHVVRSTFAAELHALLDISLSAVLVSTVFTEKRPHGAGAQSLQLGVLKDARRV